VTAKYINDHARVMQESGGIADRPTVCHVLHSLNVGGAEMLASRLAQQFSDRFHVILACLDELGQLGRELRDKGFTVETYQRRPGLDWRCVGWLTSVFRRHAVDLIHAHQYTPFLYSLLARLRHRRAAILFLEHGRHQPDYPRRKRIWMNRLLLRRRDRVLGVGEAVRQALIVNEGIPADRVGVIYNGIPLSRYQTGPEVRSEVRTELGLAPDAFVLIQVARLDPIKDHATAVRTFARVLKHRPDAHFLIVGDGPERAAIQGLRQSLGLERQVHLLGTRTDVHRLLAAADVFLLTSTSEGIPLTVIEAMAAELPVVATNVGGLAEVVQDGVTGFLAPAGDDEGIESHILHLVADEVKRKRMGRHGQERATGEFTEEQMVRHYAVSYGEMLSWRVSHV